MQETGDWGRRRVLNINELHHLVALIRELSLDPGIQKDLKDLKKGNKLRVPTVHARLESAQACVHGHTAPDSLKHRCHLPPARLDHSYPPCIGFLPRANLGKLVISCKTPVIAAQ